MLMDDENLFLWFFNRNFSKDDPIGYAHLDSFFLIWKPIPYGYTAFSASIYNYKI